MSWTYSGFIVRNRCGRRPERRSNAPSKTWDPWKNDCIPIYLNLVFFALRQRMPPHSSVIRAYLMRPTAVPFWFHHFWSYQLFTRECVCVCVFHLVCARLAPCMWLPLMLLCNIFAIYSMKSKTHINCPANNATTPE